MQADFSTTNGIYCCVCGATPAVRTSIRSHRGFLMYMRFITEPGPFCRDCGTATYRRLTVESAVLGWYGAISVVANPVIMLQNIGAAKRVRRLPAPIPGGPRAPLDPGKPLWRRVGMLGLLIPVALVPLLVGATVRAEERSASSAEVGDCVVNLHGNRTEDDNPNVEKISCSDPRATGKVIGKVRGSRGYSDYDNNYLCASYWATEFVYITEDFTLCLARP
ncbi:LppU/SCO3897 family protein [Nocardia neocaledoniensis]|uniref:LppU/SCO3897 family protein n=1 Tax=Nocardia neocaledoniensis TaxID=236511 RepID=UPI002457039C|nr:hypothetical protein [Nocardia neocaledoniensis]